MSSGDPHLATDVQPLEGDRPPRPVRATYRRLRMVGLSASEAGNLTAHLNGLRVAERAWSPEEIEGLLFIRALVEGGRIPS